MKKLIGGAVLFGALSFAGSGIAFAGEVNGRGEPTPIANRVAKSECAFSGLEDGEYITNPQDPPSEWVIGATPNKGPGWTQTPHAETAIDLVYPPGLAGLACRGTSGG